MSEAFKKRYQQATVSQKEEVHRAVATTNSTATDAVENYGDNVYSKIKSTNSVNDTSYTFQPQTKTGGAYYLPITKPADEVIEAVITSWDRLSCTDFSFDKAEYEAHGILYHNEKYMLARTKLCKLDEDPQVYLEINKLEGDGFVFADSFKKNFVAPLVNGAFVKDVKEFEPLKAEEEINGELRFLDFSTDAESAMALMQQLLTDLKPGTGIAYDGKKVFEAVSLLGHNAHDPKNLAYFFDFQEHIVSAVLEILRHEDLNFLPTVYFGSKLVNLFISTKFDEDLTNWATFANLVAALKKHCTPKEAKRSFADQQVVLSRQSKVIIMNSLEKLAFMLKDTTLEEDLKAKMFKGLDDATTAEISKILA